MCFMIVTDSSVSLSLPLGGDTHFLNTVPCCDQDQKEGLMCVCEDLVQKQKNLLSFLHHGHFSLE